MPRPGLGMRFGTGRDKVWYGDEGEADDPVDIMHVSFVPRDDVTNDLK